MAGGNPVLATASRHVSVRSFRPDPLPPELPEALKQAIRRAPSSSAMQTRSFVFVTDPAVKAALRPLCGGQELVTGCALFIVGCLDYHHLDHATHVRGYPDRSDDLRLLVTGVEDVAISQQNAALVAQAAGLGAVMVGGVIDGAVEVAELLGLPRRVVPILGLAVGYSAESPELPRPRLPAEVSFFENRYTATPAAEAVAIAHFDVEAAASGHYAQRRIPWADIGGEGPDPVPDSAYGWSEHAARKQSRLWWEEVTAKLHGDFRRLGLKLESR